MSNTASSPTLASLETSDLAAAITTLAARIAAADARWLALIAEFDRRRGWAQGGIASCAHWLNWQCGIDLGAAREKVRVAQALVGLPQIRAAFAAGTISYSKVRAMTRVATPANEDALLMLARHGTAAHVERAVRAYRRVDRLQAQSAAVTAQYGRACHCHYDEDGTLVVKARLPAEVGALFLQALRAAAEDLDTGQPAANKADAPAVDAENPHAARRADALAHLAEQFLARGAVTASTADRHLVVVHVDPTALRSSGDYQRAELEDGPAIAPTTAQRLACDAAVVTLFESPSGGPLDVGRKTRSVPAALRRALASRDQGCRFPGCTHRRYVDAHHIHHWAVGGATRLDNLVQLCRRHHRLVHEGGYTLERRDDGALLFLDPGGIPLPTVPTPPAIVADDLTRFVVEHGIDVSAETCVPRWYGEHMDLGLAVQGLSQASSRRSTE